jgi:hypothetical protein
MDNLKELLDEEKRLEKLLFPLRDRIYKLRIQQVSEKTGIKVGDTIEWDWGRHKKRRGKVVKIKLRFTDWHVFTVRTIRKDGSLGAECDAHNFDNPRKV